MHADHAPPSLPSMGRPETGGVRVSAIHVRALGEALEQHNVSPETLFERSGVAAERVQDPYGWFELAEFDLLLVSAQELTGDAAFGLHWGERSPMLQYELLPIMQAHAPTLRVALECILQAQRMFADHAEAGFSERGDFAKISIDPLGMTERGRRTRTEFGVSGLHRLFVTEGCERSIQRIAFAHARPDHWEEYDRIFGSRVRFDQAYSGIEFARVELDRPRTYRNVELHAALRSQVDQLTARLRNELTHSQRVKQAIRDSLPRIASMDDVARSLATSVRSLRRRLVEEARSYHELVDEVQRERASELLERGDRSVKQVASEVGFDSASGFHRAYRRWTGETPASATSTKRTQR